MKAETPLPRKLTHQEWTDRFNNYAQEHAETHSPNMIDFDARPGTILNFLSDWHIGHPTTHYDRITQEVEVIAKKRNSFAVMLGDLIDGMNWNPGQMEQRQIPEQIEYMTSLVDYLRDKGSLALYVSGDHDGWLMKMGVDLRQDMIDKGTHATQGPTQMNVRIPEPGESKRIGVAHQLPGNSIYNPNHPQVRAEREIFRGADIIVSGHNHRKGNQRQYTNDWYASRSVDLIALGAYKPEDSWLLKKGYRTQTPEQMYGTAVTFDKRSDEVIVDDDILRANK